MLRCFRPTGHFLGVLIRKQKFVTGIKGLHPHKSSKILVFFWPSDIKLEEHHYLTFFFLRRLKPAFFNISNKCFAENVIKYVVMNEATLRGKQTVLNPYKSLSIIFVTQLNNSVFSQRPQERPCYPELLQQILPVHSYSHLQWLKITVQYFPFLLNRNKSI